ncbi:PIN-like domain-containing protein [Actinomycetospora sp. NBC_00405]|uniref:PIN-like domain-containing protein n=1 Tax=Actinomycetospora sp. NBC_00405 TaxID=2975952 RepID=UPI002E1F03B3
MASETPEFQRERRLTTTYSGWTSGADSEAGEFVREALIVLDTNVLLALYEASPDARDQILGVLRAAVERIWVPHNAAVEFSRNRERVVLDRVRHFDRVKSTLKKAPESAVAILEKALSDLVALRDKSRTTREWNREAVKLDKESLVSRLDGVMDAAMSEVEKLEAEHDVTPRSIRDEDKVLVQLDELLAGRLGRPPSSEELEKRVRHVIDFRYPNMIPPGYLDAGKERELEAAGDFLVWRELLDELNSRSIRITRVLVVTSDLKEDWWLLDKNRNPVRARPELVQEMQEEAGAKLMLRSLSAFLSDARTYLSVDVSDSTVQQVQDAEEEAAAAVEGEGQSVSLLELPPGELEALVYELFIAMGYETAWPDIIDRRGRRFDFVATDATTLMPLRFGVECKKSRHPVRAELVHNVVGMLLADTDVDGVALVSTSSFTTMAREAARGQQIRLIDGRELVDLIREHLGIEASAVPPDEASLF